MVCLNTLENTGVDMRERVGFGQKRSVLLLREQQRILDTAKQRVAGYPAVLTQSSMSGSISTILKMDV